MSALGGLHRAGHRTVSANCLTDGVTRSASWEVLSAELWETARLRGWRTGDAASGAGSRGRRMAREQRGQKSQSCRWETTHQSSSWVSLGCCLHKLLCIHCAPYTVVPSHGHWESSCPMKQVLFFLCLKGNRSASR